MKNIHPKTIVLMLIVCLTAVLSNAQLRNPVNILLNFYGRVFDQEGRPVVGATVKLEAQADYFEENRSEQKQFTLQTDQNGDFKLIGGYGAIVTILSIEKDGFELSKKTERHYSYTVPADFHPDANNPVVFKMWKQAGKETLVEKSKIYKIVPNGQPFTIDLLKHEEKPGISPPGDIVVRINRPGELAPGRKFDWSYSIEAIDGGIIRTNSDFLYHAPEIGYEPKYEFSAPATNAHWFGWTRDQFYIKSRGGQVYGSLEVEVNSDHNGGYASFRIDSTLNPSGSHNLER
jgi:hypothetical protein